MIHNPQQVIILETLYASLRSPHVEIRAKAADNLGQISHLAAAEHQIENQLLTAVVDPLLIVRQHVAMALGSVGSKAVIPALEIRMRECAIEALGKIGSRHSFGPVVA